MIMAICVAISHPAMSADKVKVTVEQMKYNTGCVYFLTAPTRNLKRVCQEALNCSVNRFMFGGQQPVKFCLSVFSSLRCFFWTHFLWSER